MIDNINPLNECIEKINCPLLDNSFNESQFFLIGDPFNIQDTSYSLKDFIYPEIPLEMPIKDDLPQLYTIHDIISIADKYFRDPKIKEKLNEGIEIEEKEDYKFLVNEDKKKKRSKKKDFQNIKKKISNKNRLLHKKRGRKTDANSLSSHNEFSPDNIAKKIKTTLFGFILNFLNNVLNLRNENKFLKLDYQKNINYSSTREKDLNLLKMPLKSIISLDISSKYRPKPSNFNKLIIEKIINKEIFVGNDYNTIMFVLNLEYKKFIDLITHKKKIEDFINDSNEKDINCEKIKENLSKIELLFYKKLKSYEGLFASLFLFYLYNLERYIALKQKRSKKTNNDEK